jgi:hypothetical protein
VDGNIRRKVSSVFAGVDFTFPGILGFYERFQVVQARGPEHAVLLNPGINGAERLRIELIDTMATFPMLAHEMSPPQQTQMLRDGWAGNRKRAGDLSCGLRATAQEIEDGAAGGIGESLESGLVGPGRRIRNRTVTHDA